MKTEFDILCIGASAGGVNAVSKLVQHFTPDMEMAALVAFHLSEKSVINQIIDRLQAHTAFKCLVASENLLVEKQTIYIALPGDHMLLKDGRIILGQGPTENRFRPSIDVLFRSVAASIGQYATGIILTGLLNDGTAGMLAIKKCGGTCIVQDPGEAEYPDMPQSVIDNVAVDHILKIDDMTKAIKKVLKQPKAAITIIPPEIISESEIAERFAVGIDTVSNLGSQTIFACPDCGGGLWEMNGDQLHRYRCHIGHMYSERDLVKQQAVSVESTLWIALRMMEERRMMMLKLAENGKKKGFGRVAEGYFEKSVEIEVHIVRLKELLYHLHE